MEHWKPQERIEAQQINVGDPSRYYHKESLGSIAFDHENGQDSPFAHGPLTESTEINGLKIPNFSKHPIGLVSKLNTPL